MSVFLKSFEITKSDSWHKSPVFQWIKILHTIATFKGVHRNSVATTGACRGVCKEMRPVCWYRQHLFNCGHVVSHRSYATTGGRNGSVLVAALGLKGWRTAICWWWYIAWYVSCRSCYCTHVTWHNVTLKDCLIGVELSTSMCLLYSDILWDLYRKLEENLMHKEQDLWRTFVFIKDGAV